MYEISTSEVIPGNGVLFMLEAPPIDARHENLPPKNSRMSDLYDEWIDVRVRLHDGRTGVVAGVDPRPRISIDDKSTPEGDWLYIKLNNPKKCYTEERVVYRLPHEVRRVD